MDTDFKYTREASTSNGIYAKEHEGVLHHKGFQILSIIVRMPVQPNNRIIKCCWRGHVLLVYGQERFPII